MGVSMRQSGALLAAVGLACCCVRRGGQKFCRTYAVAVLKYHPSCHHLPLPLGSAARRPVAEALLPL